MVNNYLRIQLKQFTFLWCMVDSSWSFWEKKALQLSSYQDLLIVTVCWLKKKTWTNMKLLSQQWSVSPGIVHESPSHGSFFNPMKLVIHLLPKDSPSCSNTLWPHLGWLLYSALLSMSMSVWHHSGGETSRIKSYRLKMLRPTGRILKIFGGNTWNICFF